MVSSGADLEIARENKFMIIGMSIRTEIFQSPGLDFARFTLLSENPLKRYHQARERLMEIQTTSRPDHTRPDALIRIWESEHAYGETDVPKSPEPKCLKRKTEFCVVSQLGTRIRSNEKI